MRFLLRPVPAGIRWLVLGTIPLLFWLYLDAKTSAWLAMDVLQILLGYIEKAVAR